MHELIAALSSLVPEGPRVPPARSVFRRSRDDGFTLIELMIVVAIISLLAAIAIPNYLKFQCKSKQAEVKAGLGALYNAEKAFIGEHNTYGTDLVSVGWEPEGAPLYIYGFGASAYPTTMDTVTGWDPSRNDTAEAGVVSFGSYSVAKMKRLSDGSALTDADLPLTNCSGQQFTIGAAGDINPSGDITNLDRWVLDERRRTLNFPNDCND